MDNKYYSLTSFIEDGVTYIRLGDVYGWYLDKESERYGAWYTIEDNPNKTKEENLLDNWNILKKNVKQTLKQI